MQLAIRDLSKRYPNGVHALDHVSLTIAPGMFGLLGPNGAGNSTLMRTLATAAEHPFPRRVLLPPRDARAPPRAQWILARSASRAAVRCEIAKRYRPEK